IFIVSDKTISVRKAYAELLELTPESLRRIEGVQVGSIRLPVGYDAAPVEHDNEDRVWGSLDPILMNGSAGDNIMGMELRRFREYVSSGTISHGLPSEFIEQ